MLATRRGVLSAPDPWTDAKDLLKLATEDEGICVAELGRHFADQIAALKQQRCGTCHPLMQYPAAWSQAETALEQPGEVGWMVAQ